MKKTLLSVFVVAFVNSISAQGFINLDFESANIVLIDPSTGRSQFNPAFPGWSATSGGILLSQALYNNTRLSGAGISIIDSSSTVGILIQGNYTAVLQSGGLTNTQTGVDTSLFQTGEVPVGTKSLQFLARTFLSPTGQFTVTMNGQLLSLLVLSAGADYNLYGADVSTWGGQSAELSFNVLGVTPQVSSRSLYLDAIQFSSSPIPEPSTLALTTLGCGLLALYRRKL